MNDVRQVRLEKLEKIRALGINPYPDRFSKTHTLAEAKSLPIGSAPVTIAGRLMTTRGMGKLTFAHLQDFSGRLQVVLQKEKIGEEQYKFFADLVDNGDFVGCTGEIFQTKHGEISLLVESFILLSKSLRPLPEKWHGVQDREIIYRERYLDLISSRESLDRFKFKTQFVREIRAYLEKNDFWEIDTPALCNKASGALAKPFVTHHNALDTDVYLRIAPETYLKRAVVGGFERVFEFARCFRNEGVDPSHLQDFTMLEYYAAYWNYEDNMAFTEKMLVDVLQKLTGKLEFDVMGRDFETITKVDFTGPWPRVTMRDLILTDSGIDIEKFTDADSLRKEIKKQKIDIQDIDKLGRGNLIDGLYKKVSRPKLIKPTFVIKQPTDLSPLARLNDEDPTITDRFQLVVNTWEVVNAYSELVDPVDQADRFELQAQDKAQGDEEAHGTDDDYIRAMEHGMPPMSGWGMGIERIVALLTAQPNVRDVVLFPLMREETEQSVAGKSKQTMVAHAVILDTPDVPNWSKLNAAAHLSAAFAAREGKKLIHIPETITTDGGHIPMNIQHAIMMRSTDDKNQLIKLKQQAEEAGLVVSCFTKEMRETTNDKKVKEVQEAKALAEIEFLGVLVFGEKSEVEGLTKSFPLVK